MLMKLYFIDHSGSNLKAFLSDTKHIILLKNSKRISLIFSTSVILDFQYVILHKTWVLTIPNMQIIDLQNIKFEMKSDAEGWGGGASFDNVTILLQLTELADSMVFAVLFGKFAYWSHSLKEETCGQRSSPLCEFWSFPGKFMSMKFVKICHLQKFISAKLFRTGYQQKFMSAKF